MKKEKKMYVEFGRVTYILPKKEAEEFLGEYKNFGGLKAAYLGARVAKARKNMVALEKATRWYDGAAIWTDYQGIELPRNPSGRLLDPERV